MVRGLEVAAAGVLLAGVALMAGHPTNSNSQSNARFQWEDAARQNELYLPPVDAEVVDVFRLPKHVGAPGNRGWEYDSEPGQPVWASAEGEVVFAGSVAHNRFVTVLHRDGLRTAYGYLGWIAVVEGDRVAPGQLLGTTSERFFFSVRAGDDYLDPASVLTAGRVRLVPHREPDGLSRLPAYG